ncbi:hypothetical protein Glove_313g46 [Diversispora epigaea]|uniref:Uncharacterized protein n=1 Tax=Diversispora epigaea TaxID=1348612 RepID=A0A397HR12_9GLOM|nr:hypothetical protein Glove_313g46 [Diversispora epigaea]
MKIPEILDWKDYLFSFRKKYDLRFMVILDKFERLLVFGGSSERNHLVIQQQKTRTSSPIEAAALKIPLLKKAISVKVTKKLLEFGLGPRPTIPTERLCSLDGITKTIQTLLEIKKGLDEHELLAKLVVVKLIFAGVVIVGVEQVLQES